jgi:hypothetical protein
MHARGRKTCSKFCSRRATRQRVRLAPRFHGTQNMQHIAPTLRHLPSTSAPSDPEDAPVFVWAANAQDVVARAEHLLQGIEWDRKVSGERQRQVPKVTPRAPAVVCWAGSCSPSLLETLPASLGAGLLRSGLVLAERLGAMTGMGSRGRVHPPKVHPPKTKRGRQAARRLLRHHLRQAVGAAGSAVGLHREALGRAAGEPRMRVLLLMLLCVCVTVCCHCAGRAGVMHLRCGYAAMREH